MNRKEILDNATRHVTKDRAATHGDVEDSFAKIAAVWSAMLGHTITAQQVGLMMVGFKAVRAMGNPGHQDNYEDMAGYAACAAECAEGNYFEEWANERREAADPFGSLPVGDNITDDTEAIKSIRSIKGVSLYSVQPNVIFSGGEWGEGGEVSCDKRSNACYQAVLKFFGHEVADKMTKAKHVVHELGGDDFIMYFPPDDFPEIKWDNDKQGRRMGSASITYSPSGEGRFEIYLKPEVTK